MENLVQVLWFRTLSYHFLLACCGKKFPLSVCINFIDLSLGWLSSHDGDLLLHGSWYAGEIVIICCIHQICVSFVYHTAFLQLFGTIRIAPIDDPDGSEINDYNNFSNFFRAFLVMIRYEISLLIYNCRAVCFLSSLSLSLLPSFSIRVTTGENWPDVMLDCLGGQPCELQSPGTDDCGDNFAYVFFIVYYVLTTILVSAGWWY